MVKVSKFSLKCVTMSYCNDNDYYVSRPDLADVSCHGAHLEAAGAGVRLLADEVGVVLLSCLPAPS